MKKIWVQWFIYWGYESDAIGPLASISWLAMMEPPFYHGKALRLRQRRMAVYFGICRKAKKPLVRPTEKTPEEIGTWVY